ncbi:hypothetical protein VTN49DRAFT_3143 [Thermomyces lanuginosus]|uniref:uncharacterized protein n=1 Tax=Thermomyces lanuginosus TaxID=5541 RepID=UPI003743DD66
MRASWWKSLLAISIASLLPGSNAVRFLRSQSLDPCSDNPKITASLFDVIYFPDNATVQYDINAYTMITGKVNVQFQVIAYGYQAATIDIDPCDGSLTTNFCPIEATGPIELMSSNQLPDDIVPEIPGIAFTIPDLDGRVRIYIKSAETGETLTCVEASLSNGKTVYQKAVGWTLAVISGLALIASAVAAGFGFSNTAAHVAANTLSMFGFFQAQAMYGMTSVRLPPIVAAWMQNFQWSMGIIRVGFLQTMSTWYQKATGGTPSTIISTLSETSVSIHKRSMDALSGLAKRSLHAFQRREEINAEGNVVLRGIERVGFKARIENSNIFMTGLIFFAAFVIFVIILVILFYFWVKLAVRKGWIRHDRFLELQRGWTNVLRGILFRIILLGFPQMVVLCLWELTRRDSIAEAVLAAMMIASMTATLGWAAVKVILLAKRSVTMHKNPAYILFSNPKVLHTWGFLYVQFRATAYFWIVPTLVYLFAKGAFVGLAQKAPLVQTIGLLVIETASLVAACLFRPWMDRKTNTFNIAIAAVHFVNAVFLLIFTSVFNQPQIVNSVMGVVLVLYNAVFALVQIIMVLVSAIYAIASKNPDLRYEPVRDDRGSFIRSQTTLNQTKELDALGMTARGEDRGPRF